MYISSWRGLDRVLTMSRFMIGDSATGISRTNDSRRVTKSRIADLPADHKAEQKKPLIREELVNNKHLALGLCYPGDDGTGIARCDLQLFQG